MRSAVDLKILWQFVYNMFELIEQSDTIEKLESLVQACTAVLSSAGFAVPKRAPQIVRKAELQKGCLKVHICERGEQETESHRVVTWGVSIDDVKGTPNLGRTVSGPTLEFACRRYTSLSKRLSTPPSARICCSNLT